MAPYTLLPPLFVLIAALGQFASADPMLAPVIRDDPLTAARTAWFREAHFGLFIHWGLYSVAAGQWEGKAVSGLGEWILDKGRIPNSQYEELSSRFDPRRFDAKAWVAVAKDAGMKYLVITAKHHDGFCMWRTRFTPYNIVDATPFGRDPIHELSAACREAGIRFGIYYSIMDWHHPELSGYWNAGEGAAKDPADPRVIAYIEEQMKPQLRELIENDRPDLLWFDGEWVPWWNAGHGKDLQDFCRRLKPDIVINNRVGKRQPADGDYETPEQEIPASVAPHRLWETCMTLNDTWGFKTNDRNWKPSSEVIDRLHTIRSRGGNFLLNVGPDGTGVIPDACLDILHETGEALRRHAAAGPKGTP